MATKKTISLLIDCLICEDKRVNNDPRQLTCKHGFCLCCLKTKKSLLSDGKIQCPVCWEKTPLPEGSLAGLPDDTKVAAVEKSIHLCKSANTCVLCRYKGIESEACAFCVDCEFRLCRECVSGHQESDKYTGHVTTSNICKLHIRHQTHACLTCYEYLCYECLMSEFHKDHEVSDKTHVKEKVNDVMKKRQSMLKDEIEDMDQMMNNIMDKALEDLTLRRKETDEKLEQYKKKLFAAITASMDKRDEHFHKATTEALEQQSHASSNATNCLNEIQMVTEEEQSNVLHILSEKNLEMFQAVVFLRDAKAIQVDCPKLEEDRFISVENIESGNIEFSFTLGGIAPSNISVFTAKPEKRLHLSKLSGEVKGFQNLWSIVALPDGSAVLADSTEIYAVKINTEGKKTHTYTTPGGQNIRGLAYNKGKLFLGSKTDITIVDEHGKRVIKLEDKFKGMGKISALACDGEQILIVELGRRLLQHSFEGEIHRQLAKGAFMLVSVADLPNLGKVFLAGEFSKNQLFVLKPDGSLLNTVGKHGTGDGEFLKIRDSAVLPNGNILIVDEDLHRVSEFRIDGTFVRHLLTEIDGLKKPISLSFACPYLWIACYEAVLLFKWT